MRVAVPMLLLAACAGEIPEDRWDDRSARASCKNARRCDASTFWFDYEDLGACIDDTVRGSRGLYAGCDYDPVAAGECVQALGWSCRRVGREYDELVRRCDAVWTCTEP